jgi:hypothetical protein
MMMKKIFFTLLLFLTVLQFTNAQLSFGIKGGINQDLNSEASEYIDLPTGYSLETNSTSGFHAGLWMRVKVPVVGLYVRPEVNYATLNSEYNIGIPLPGSSSPIAATAKYEMSKIDVPVLLGLKILKFGNVFIGPNFQYLLKSNLEASSESSLITPYKNDDVDEDITMGIVVGAGLEVWKFGVDVRFETGFNIPDEDFNSFADAQDSFEKITEALGNKKPNQIIVGLSYKF